MRTTQPALFLMKETIARLRHSYQKRTESCRTLSQRKLTFLLLVINHIQQNNTTELLDLKQPLNKNYAPTNTFGLLQFNNQPISTP